MSSGKGSPAVADVRSGDAVAADRVGDAKGNIEPSDPRMEQIRELMLGGLTRESDARLRELREHVDGELASLADAGEQRMAELEQRLQPQLERVQAQVRQEVVNRANALDDVDMRLHQALRTLRGEINAELQRHQGEAEAMEVRFRAALAELKRLMQETVGGVRASLSEARGGLESQKLAREDLADLLAEVALRLRGAGAADNGG